MIRKKTNKKRGRGEQSTPGTEELAADAESDIEEFNSLSKKGKGKGKTKAKQSNISLDLEESYQEKGLEPMNLVTEVLETDK